MKINPKKIVIVLLFFAALLSGIALLFFGIKNSVSLAIKTKDWFEAPGYFRDYSIYDIDDDGETTYRLKYVFYSGGTEYKEGIGFDDITEQDAYAEAAINSLAGYGIINGKGAGRFDPFGYSTRAEVATVMSRLIKSILGVMQ